MKHMKRLMLGVVLGLIVFIPVVMKTAAVQTAPAAGSQAGGAADPNRAMLTTYCMTCHSTRAKMGGLALDEINT